jgi:hypothetical protein
MRLSMLRDVGRPLLDGVGECAVPEARGGVLVCGSYGKCMCSYKYIKPN